MKTINKNTLFNKKIVILMLLASVWCNASAYGNSPIESNIGVDQLNKIADSVRNFKPKDEFGKPKEISILTGKRFSIDFKVTPLRNNKNYCEGNPAWSFYPPDKFYILAGSGWMINQANSSKFAPLFRKGYGYLNYLPIACQSYKDKYYLASNAFGATTTVSIKNQKITAFTRPKTFDESFVDRMPNFQWSSNIPGDLARSLSKNIIFRMTGVIGTWPKGENLLCDKIHFSPSFEYSTERNADICIYKTDSLYFQIVDGAKNEILYEFDADN